MPYCALQLPADHHGSLDGAAQDDVVVIPASVELGADVDLAVLVAPDAVGDRVAAVDRGLVGDEPGLDGPAPVVDDERVGLDGGGFRCLCEPGHGSDGRAILTSDHF